MFFPIHLWVLVWSKYFIKAMVAVTGGPSEMVKPWLSFYSAEWVGINLAQLDRGKLMIIYTDDIIRLHAVLRY